MLNNDYSHLKFGELYARDAIIEAFSKFENPLNASPICHGFESQYESSDAEKTMDAFFDYMVASEKSYPKVKQINKLDGISSTVQDVAWSLWNLPWNKYWKRALLWVAGAAVITGSVNTGQNFSSDTDLINKNNTTAMASAESIARMKEISTQLANPRVVMSLSKEGVWSMKDAGRVQRAMEHCREPLSIENITELPEVCHTAIDVLADVLDRRSTEVINKLSQVSDVQSHKINSITKVIEWYHYWVTKSLDTYKSSPNNKVARLDSILNITKLFEAVANGQHYLTDYNSSIDRMEWLRRIKDAMWPIIASLEDKKKRSQWA